MKPLSQAELLELLTYNAATGEFKWLVSRGKAKAGTVAGSDLNGYVCIRINRQNYLAHRLVWLYEFGRWPNEHLDHIDGNPKNDRLANLRECSHAENHQNVGTRRDNRAGAAGVYLHRGSGRYTAEIRVDGKRHSLGYHDTREEAHAAYLKAKAELHTFQPTPRTPYLVQR
jgi:hypothetical protein